MFTRHILIKKASKSYLDPLLVFLSHLVYLSLLGTTKTTLTRLREFNKNDWVVRYPTLQEQASDVSATSSSLKPRRSLSFVDNPLNQTDIVYTASRHAFTRAVTLAPISNAHENESNAMDDEELHSDKIGNFSILRLDLKLGPHGSLTAPASLVLAAREGVHC
jgi:mitofusin